MIFGGILELNVDLIKSAIKLLYDQPTATSLLSTGSNLSTDEQYYSFMWPSLSSSYIPIQKLDDQYFSVKL